MYSRKHKVLNRLLPKMSVAFLILSCGITIFTSCNKTPDVETITLTFDAKEGTIVGQESSTTTLVIDKGTQWSSISSKYTAHLEGHSFKGWSIDGTKVIDDLYVFESDAKIIALYEDHQHVYESYTITEEGSTNRRVCGICSVCHETVELTDEELEELDGYIIIKNEDGSFSNPIDVDNDLSYTVQYAQGESIDIYLIHGLYYIYGDRTGVQFPVHLHGINNLQGNKVSTLDSFNEDIPYPHLWYNRGISLFCDNMILAGKSDTSYVFYGGIQCNHLNCSHCEITGGQAAYCDTCTFTDCVFDSTNLVNEGRTKTDYCLYLYERYATIHNCTFKSLGKALKIYADGARPNNSYEIWNCEFIIGEGDSIEPKDAINVDGSNAGTAPYQVYVDPSCKLTGYTGIGLYNEDAINTVFYNTPRPTEPE